jgi:hypothetical protein
MSGDESVGLEKLERLIADAKASGGSEMANYQLFVIGLTEALGLERPKMAGEANQFNDYVFERRVDFKHPDGSRSAGRIDCYKRGAFVLEAKQSAKRQTKRPDTDQLHLLPEDAMQSKPGQAKRGTRGWDQVMLAARNQAETYTRALPVDHGYPPFLLIVDVGHVIEVYADFSGLGKDYAHFPDRRSYRISMDDLRDCDVQARLKSIWTDPHSLNPAKRSAEVTSDIAARLARIAKSLEGRHDPKDVAEFLMRCLFTMFAEDVELIPEKSFENFLKELKDKPASFVPAMENLWSTMDTGGFDARMVTQLKRFNGSLFKKRTALPLDADQIHELYVAAAQDWRDVEPAIFGTLLERALDSRERSKLGAHYTPRAYVERLVIPTIIEPLRADWEEVKAQVEDQRKAGDMDGALKTIKTFHHRLCTTRVLDPACGTGNFLYVALELMKKLEGEVLEALDAFGDQQSRFVMQGETVSPSQFYGLELNPRAVPVADLVLWIGYLKWQLKTTGLASITEPVLHAYGMIRHQDALIEYRSKELDRDSHGRPKTIWDGRTYKINPISGVRVPDETAQEEVYIYKNPKAFIWPDAEFVVGNPPFIGNKRMIQRLGKGYVDAVRAAYPTIPDSVDFVMYWWWKAAEKVANTSTKYFGLVTTSKITQTFNRRVVRQHLSGKLPISISFAIPDHPWNDENTTAAVRVALTVVRAGKVEGVIKRVVGEEETEPIDFSTSVGFISARLESSGGLDAFVKLLSNSSLPHQGVIPLGEGFRLSEFEAAKLFRENQQNRKVIKPYKIGRDLLQRDQGLFIIDLYGLSWETVSQKYQSVAQVVTDRVKPQRDTNRREKRKEKYWLYADSCEEMRNGLAGLARYIATCRTAKHRTFVFLDGTVLPDAKIVAVTQDSPDVLATLSARSHTIFSENQGGWQGVGNDPVYQHSDTFNPFPFPACITDQSNPALRQRLHELGERLDAFRRERLATHDFLTMTSLYNVLEWVRELDNGCDVKPLPPAERDIYEAGLIAILKEIHDDIDRAAFEAYGWQDLGARLIGRPGATLPSMHKSEDQEQAEEELLTRLVALNLERQEEEKRGHVRWLRPDYQIAKLGAKVAKPHGEEQLEADVGVISVETKPKWPSDGLAQIRIVRDVLAKSAAPAAPDEISLAFDGRNSPTRKDRVRQVLETLVATGAARTADEGGRSRYFVAR